MVPPHTRGKKCGKMRRSWCPIEFTCRQKLLRCRWRNDQQGHHWPSFLACHSLENEVFSHQSWMQALAEVDYAGWMQLPWTRNILLLLVASIKKRRTNGKHTAMERKHVAMTPFIIIRTKSTEISRDFLTLRRGSGPFACFTFAINFRR